MTAAEKWLIDEGYAESFPISRSTLATILSRYASQSVNQPCMKWIKASERLPEKVDKRKLNAKYKGQPELLVCLEGSWYWYELSFLESRKYPVDKDSWSVIEWIDESVNHGEGVEGLIEFIEKEKKDIIKDYQSDDVQLSEKLKSMYEGMNLAYTCVLGFIKSKLTPNGK